MGQLNYGGKFDADVMGPHSNAHFQFDSLSQPGDANTVTIPDAHLLFSGDYQRSGADLIVSDRDHRVVVPDYFHGAKRPTLVSPDGAQLDPKVIEALTGHVAYAQAAGTASAAKVVGQVVKMTGSASIVRNGVTIDVNNGDNVYQNDVVQTGSGSTLGLVMIDGTPALSCRRKPEQIDGHDVVTVEGLPADTRRILSEAFVLEGGVQCGFCIPGILVRAASLMQQGRATDRPAVAKALEIGRAHV